MLGRFRRTAILALALVVLVPCHWAMLQTVAWTTMIVSYSRDVSLGEAVTRTFDGRHPCRLCVAIQEGRAKEDSQSAAPLTLRPLDLWLAPIESWRSEPPPADRVCSRISLFSSRSERPPWPRPRFASLPDRA